MIPATLEYSGPLLVIRFREPQICLSWAVVNGGRTHSSCVAWYYLDQNEYPLLAEPDAFLNQKLTSSSLKGAVGLMTSRKRYGVVEAMAQHEDLACWCMATVGLRNALRTGDPPYELPPTGTINLLCWLSRPLTTCAELEALTIAAEARTAAVMDAGIPSSVSGEPSTGTGTDCIVLAHPVAGPEIVYAGTHTPAGHLIGKAVYQAVSRGIQEWLEEQQPDVP